MENLKKPITNKELTRLIEAYKKEEINEALLKACFVKIAKLFCNEEAFVEEVAQLCLVKANKFDPSRGKAWNFFSTIIACYHKQWKRLHENHNKS